MLFSLNNNRFISLPSVLQFQHLETVIKARIPSITSLINKSIDELESEMDYLGRPIGIDAGVSGLVVLMEVLVIIFELYALVQVIFVGSIVHYLGALPRF